MSEEIIVLQKSDIGQIEKGKEEKNISSFFISNFEKYYTYYSSTDLLMIKEIINK